MKSPRAVTVTESEIRGVTKPRRAVIVTETSALRQKNHMRLNSRQMLSKLGFRCQLVCRPLLVRSRLLLGRCISFLPQARANKAH